MEAGEAEQTLQGPSFVTVCNYSLDITDFGYNEPLEHSPEVHYNKVYCIYVALS